MKNWKQINELQKNVGNQLSNAFGTFKQIENDLSNDPTFILFCEAANKATSEERLLELVKHKSSSVSSKAAWSLQENYAYPIDFFWK